MKEAIYRIEHHNSIAETLHALAYAYYHLSDYDNALDCSNKALEMKIALYGEAAATKNPDIGSIYLAKGKIHLARKEYNTAKEHLLKALDINEKAIKETPNYKSLGDTYSAVEDLYMHENNLPLADFYAELSMHYIQLACSKEQFAQEDNTLLELINLKYRELSNYYYGLADDLTNIAERENHLRLSKKYLQLSEHFYQKLTNKCVSYPAYKQTIFIDNKPIHLTQREYEVIKALSKGLLAKQTAALLNISVRTVEVYLTQVREKAQCRSKLELLSKISFSGK